MAAHVETSNPGLGARGAARWRRARLLSESAPAALALGVGVLLGIARFVAPLVGPVAPASSGRDFINHTALVAGALDTLRTTGGLPISSDKLVPGTEYPYYLFGNAGFYVGAALISFLLRVPPYIGVGTLLAVAFALGAGGMYRLGRHAGLKPYLAVALALLYAAGPYLSVNLWVRFAFPEYVAWQAMPILLLASRRALFPDAGTWTMLGGAVALATPFYLHKLIAPHMAMVLAALALNSAPWTRRTLVRLAILGLVAICFSVPAWYPLLDGMNAESVSANSRNQRPGVIHPSWANLFWPWAENSLSEADKERDPVYGERFALQVGLVPMAGGLLALATLIARPRLAVSRRLAGPLLILVGYLLLVMNGFRIWDVMPSPLAYVQFSYRLLGIIHLVGFLLLAQVLASPAPPVATLIPARLRLPAATLLVGLAALSTGTYWRPPNPSGVASAEVRPQDLADFSRFYAWTGPSNLQTGRAIGPDDRLAIPPVPIPIPDGAPSLTVAGEAPPSIFRDSAEPLIVRLYGFGKRSPSADPLQLTALFRARPGRSYPVHPIHDLIERESRESRRARNSVTAGRPIAVPDVDWSVVRLAETTVAAAGRFELGARLDGSVDAVALECSRAVDVPRQYVGWSSERPTCVVLTMLAAPNQGDVFVEPREIPAERRARAAHGSITLDSRDLPPGDYLLPTFDYRFVRVRAADGAPISTSLFAARPVVRHDGNVPAYTITYALELPALAILAGLVLFGVYAAAERRVAQRRPRRGVRPAEPGAAAPG